MKIFGRKSGRASARPALLRASYGTVMLGEWPRGYEAQLREGYIENPVAQRAVRLLSESAGTARSLVGNGKLTCVRPLPPASL